MEKQLRYLPIKNGKKIVIIGNFITLDGIYTVTISNSLQFRFFLFVVDSDNFSFRAVMRNVLYGMIFMDFSNKKQCPV